MRIKIWTVITDGGDGSSYVCLFPTEAAARANLDDEDFMINEKGTKYEWIDDIPSKVSWEWFDTDGCEVA